MELFKLYYEEHTENLETVSRVILPVVRTNMGYGIFYWKVRNGKMYQFDARSIMDAPAYFCNNKVEVESYDKGFCHLYRQPDFKLIDVSNEPYARTIIQVALESESFIDTYKRWVK